MINLPIETRQFSGKRLETGAEFEGLAPISQAGLKQFSLERMLGYGVDYADAIELRARIIDGVEWKQAAISIAEDLLALAPPKAPFPTRISACHRAAALLRMGQMMMLENTQERAALYARSADLYQQASELGLNRERVLIDGPGGRLAGWLINATIAPAVGSAIVFGGIEGWAMDFDSMGDALATRGVDALMLDCPGQGETRFAHDHYLTTDWLADLTAVIDYLTARAPDRPIGIVGNSMGGSLAMNVAGTNKRIAACCNNGGVIKPSMGRTVGGAFFAKMVAFCGAVDEDQATSIWESVTPLEASRNPGYPLLVIQGGRDILVPTAHGQMLLDMAPTQDKRMVLFSDGDHCIYNHRSDRDNLVADWMLERLSAAPGSQS
jgi:alpha-beta hydrolase superfamily lysophospholipase